MFMVAGAIFRALIRSDIYKKIVIQPFEFLSGSLTHNKSEAKKRIIKSPADQNGPQVCCSHKIKSILSVYCLKFAIHPVIIVQSAVFNLQSSVFSLLSAVCIVFSRENKKIGSERMIIYKEGGFSAQTSIGELLNALAPPPISPTATLGIQSLTRSLQSTVFLNPGGCLLSVTDRLTQAGHTENLVSNM